MEGGAEHFIRKRGCRREHILVVFEWQVAGIVAMIQ